MSFWYQHLLGREVSTTTKLYKSMQLLPNFRVFFCFLYHFLTVYYQIRTKSQPLITFFVSFSIECACRWQWGYSGSFGLSWLPCLIPEVLAYSRNPVFQLDCPILPKISIVQLGIGAQLLFPRDVSGVFNFSSQEMLPAVSFQRFQYHIIRLVYGQRVQRCEIDARGGF